MVSAPTRFSTVALRPIDETSSMADLHGIAKKFQYAGSFEEVLFPWRPGDKVDYLIDVRLRQKNITPSSRNTLAAIGIGLSLGLLSPVLGLKIIESHDVTFLVSDSTGELSRQSFSVSTEGRFGLGVDEAGFAKELDDAQIDTLSRELLHRVEKILNKHVARKE
ncbi:MAG: hypothetical protein AAF735_08360 [Myxococcota bacterium]